MDLSSHIEVRNVAGIRILMLHRPVTSVVTFSGSIDLGIRGDSNDDIVLELLADLLDKGTRARDRFEVADQLERRGAEISFGGDGLRLGISGQCLSDDVPLVLELAAEQLREPVLDAAEFDKSRLRMASGIRRGMEQTGRQAGIALSQRLYTPAHPNFSRESEVELSTLASVTRDDVVEFHTNKTGSQGLVLCFAGDLNADLVERSVQEYLGDWEETAADAVFDANGRRPEEPEVQHIEIEDRQNLDVRFGHTLELRRDQVDFIPLSVAVHILGGNFSARLMQKVRDELGLTYGIQAGLSGVEKEYEGSWQVYVTLSQENLNRGIEATQAELKRFVEGGITSAELTSKKTTITGNYIVGLSTTGGIARTLHRHAALGFAPDYIDEYPRLVEAVTEEDIERVVSEYLDPLRLEIVSAGTRPVSAPA